MLKHNRLNHRFVRSIPKVLEPGVLYVSVEYATAIHSCCCGCGQSVVTPITPTDWQLTFDGESISLSPSIGNWGFRCRSHYFIKNGNILEAGQWGQGMVEAGRRQDKVNKAHYYQSTLDVNAEDSRSSSGKKGLLGKIVHWIFGGGR